MATTVLSQVPNVFKRDMKIPRYWNRYVRLIKLLGKTTTTSLPITLDNTHSLC